MTTEVAGTVTHDGGGGPAVHREHHAGHARLWGAHGGAARYCRCVRHPTCYQLVLLPPPHLHPPLSLCHPVLGARQRAAPDAPYCFPTLPSCQRSRLSRRRRAKMGWKTSWGGGCPPPRPRRGCGGRVRHIPPVPLPRRRWG